MGIQKHTAQSYYWFIWTITCEGSGQKINRLIEWNLEGKCVYVSEWKFSPVDINGIWVETVTSMGSSFLSRFDLIQYCICENSKWMSFGTGKTEVKDKGKKVQEGKEGKEGKERRNGIKVSNSILCLDLS